MKGGITGNFLFDPFTYAQADGRILAFSIVIYMWPTREQQQTKGTKTCWVTSLKRQTMEFKTTEQKAYLRDARVQDSSYKL